MDAWKLFRKVRLGIVHEPQRAQRPLTTDESAQLDRLLREIANTPDIEEITLDMFPGRRPSRRRF